MRKILSRLGTLCLMLLAAVVAKGQDVIATWDFQHMAAGAVSIEHGSGTVNSDVEGIVMEVDATNGKLKSRGGDAQFNANTILKVPVKSSRDLVTVVSYPGYHNYTISGTAAADDSVTVKAKTADVRQGYVEVVGTGSSYLYRVRVNQVSAIQEKNLYDTSFPDAEWGTFSRKENNDNPTVKTFSTKYSHEKITFTLCGVGVEDVNNSKFPDVTRAMISAKYTNEVKTTEPYAVTSALANVTKVVFHQTATGGNRGWAVAARTAGTEKWDTLYYKAIGQANGEDITIDVNRENVELKFFNFNISQNAYMSELHIYGKVDMSKTPSLATFTANGVTYQAADVFDEDADGNNVTTIEISKKDKMIDASNPVTATADNGELGTITYESVASTLNGDKPESKVIIPVIIPAGDAADTALYVINAVWKPDYTVNYYDVDNATVVATQTVEKDAAIANLNDGSNVTVAKGSKFRGWLLDPFKDEKAGADYVVTDNPTSLYALVTDIEGDETNERHEYNFKNRYFYPEDHEALNLSSAKYYYNGNRHGYGMNGSGSFSVDVNGNATVIYEGCAYDNADSIVVSDSKGRVVANIKKNASDGTKTTFKYVGDATTLTFTFDNTIYVHSLTVINTGTGDIAKNAEGYYVATAGDANSVLSILDIIQANEDGNSRVKVFLPNGTYHFGRMTEKEFPVNNISIIGQSMDSTILVTAPDKSVEGLGSADMFFNTKTGIYFQDLTLQNALAYYVAGSAGRAAVIQDRGNRTIYKNVRMLSYQDTYYSQNSAMQSYFSGCDLHGTVDFLCGGGDVRFDSTTISLEPRNKATGSGGRTITAPTTTTRFGYVFDGCKVVDLATNGAGDWNYGRTWQSNPICVWLNTTLDDVAAKTIVPSRWTQKGMNNRDPKVFGEYNTMDETGKNITPESNIITSYGGQFETILNAEQAAAYAYDSMFTDWDPRALSSQLAVKNAKGSDGSLSWDATEGAEAYAVFVDGKFDGITAQTSYAPAATGKRYEVRAANAMGGFGPAAVVATADAIDSVTTNNVVAYDYYTVDGMRLAKAQRGLNIRVSHLANGSTVTEKIIVK